MNLAPGDQELSMLLAQLDQNRGEQDLREKGFQGAEAHTVGAPFILPTPGHAVTAQCPNILLEEEEKIPAQVHLGCIQYPWKQFRAGVIIPDLHCNTDPP